MSPSQGREIRVPVPGPPETFHGQKSPVQKSIWTRAPKLFEEMPSSTYRYEDWISQQAAGFYNVILANSELTAINRLQGLPKGPFRTKNAIAL